MQNKAYTICKLAIVQLIVRCRCTAVIFINTNIAGIY